MKKRLSHRLDSVFGALSDPIRRSILTRLTHGECSITTLAAPFDVTAPAITKHLRVLESSGLITRRKEGRVNYCCLTGDPLREANDWIHEQRTFWEQQLKALETYLEKEKAVCDKPQPNTPGSSSGSQSVLVRRAKKSSERGRNPKS